MYWGARRLSLALFEASWKPLLTQEWYADFLRDVEFDEETGEEKGAPKVYEPAEWETVKGKAYYYLGKYNEAYPARAMQLVLFDEAMQHLMKINRHSFSGPLKERASI